MTLVYVLLAMGCVSATHFWAWRRALRREKWAPAVYLGWTLLGALWPIALLFGLVGLEEVAGGALVPERLPLVTGLLFFLGLVAAGTGAIVIAWRRRRQR